jgi:transcription elongation GreA/GreB family factor
MKISDESPIGKSLVGLKKDAVAHFEAQGTTIELKIIDISK